MDVSAPRTTPEATKQLKKRNRENNRKIPNHERDIDKRWCISQMPSSNLPSGRSNLPSGQLQKRNPGILTDTQVSQYNYRTTNPSAWMTHLNVHVSFRREGFLWLHASSHLPAGRTALPLSNPKHSSTSSAKLWPAWKNRQQNTELTRIIWSPLLSLSSNCVSVDFLQNGTCDWELMYCNSQSSFNVDHWVNSLFVSIVCQLQSIAWNIPAIFWNNLSHF